MLTVIEARERILAQTHAGLVEEVPLGSAWNRVLARDVLAEADSPSFDRSAMDGYALADKSATQPYLLSMTIKAGDVPTQPLSPGETARVFTGAQVPVGTVCVVPQELVQAEVGRVTVQQWPAVSHVRRRGEDHKTGDILVKAGQRLKAVELGVLAGEGVVHPIVSEQPRILHVVTGDELVDPAQLPGAGQIRDSNSALIAGLLAENGAETILQLRLKDDFAGLLQTIRDIPEDRYQVLLISGGASVGDHDWTRRVLESLGFQIEFEQVRVRPGKPLIFAHRGSQLAFGLPGNPVSHLACFHLFVKPALEKMLGLQDAPSFPTALLAEDWPHELEPREAYIPSRLSYEKGAAQLTPVRWESSGHLSALVGVNALLRLPSGTGNLVAGQLVEYLKIG